MGLWGPRDWDWDGGMGLWGPGVPCWLGMGGVLVHATNPSANPVTIGKALKNLFICGIRLWHPVPMASKHLDARRNKKVAHSRIFNSIIEPHSCKSCSYADTCVPILTAVLTYLVEFNLNFAITVVG